MAHCQQAGWKRDAGDPSVQLQQSLLQQVRCITSQASLQRKFTNQRKTKPLVSVFCCFFFQHVRSTKWECVSMKKEKGRIGSWSDSNSSDSGAEHPNKGEKEAGVENKGILFNKKHWYRRSTSTTKKHNKQTDKGWRKTKNDVCTLDGDHQDGAD